jgi:MoxR-like ATPase
VSAARQRYLDLEDGAVIELDAGDGMEPSVHVIDQDSIDAVNAALAIGRPLLVRGEPGTGKSQLARAAATALGRSFVHHAVDGGTETRDLIWKIDGLARLAQAQVLGALRELDGTRVARELDIRRFVEPGPLWWGFDWDGAAKQAKDLAPGVHAAAPGGVRRDNGCVVLVDEIDKADASVPNGLLDALGNRCFAVPGVGTVRMDPARPPLIVITTNEERALPDAFLRRCLVLQLALPAEPSALVAFLLGRGRAHYADRCGDAVLLRAAELVASDRLEMRSREVAAPGLAEYVDLVGVAVEQAETDVARLELLDRVRKFALRKHPEEPVS